MYDPKDECAKCLAAGLFEDCPPKDKIAKWRKEKIEKELKQQEMDAEFDECARQIIKEVARDS